MSVVALLDKTWNEAIEAAAKDCEFSALGFRSMNGETGNWAWEAANRMDEQAANIRKLKR